MTFDSGADSWQAFTPRPLTTSQEPEPFPELTAPETASPAAQPDQPAPIPDAPAIEPLRDSLRETAPSAAPAAPRPPAAAVDRAFGAAKARTVPAPSPSYALSSELTPLDSEAAAGTSASFAPISFAAPSEGDSGSGEESSGARGREPSESHPQAPSLVDYAPMAADAALPELAAPSEEAGEEASGGDEGGGGDDEGGGDDDSSGDDGGGGGGGDDGGGGLGDAWDIGGLEDGEPWEFEPGGYELPDSDGGGDSESAGPRRRKNLPPECRKRSHRGGITAIFRDFFKCLRALRKQAREAQAAATLARLDPMCRRGRIAPERCGRALSWYREQAAHGDPGSHFMVGTGYAQGREVPQDRVEAYAWYLRAGQLGHTPSQEVVGMMEPRMTPEMIAEARRRAEQLGGRPASTAKASPPAETPKARAKPSHPRLTTTLTPI